MPKYQEPGMELYAVIIGIMAFMLAIVFWPW